VDVLGVARRADGRISVAGNHLRDVRLAPGQPEETLLASTWGGAFTSAWDADGKLAASTVVASPTGGGGIEAHTTTGTGDALVGNFSHGTLWGLGRPGEAVGPDAHCTLGRLDGEGGLVSLTEVLGQPSFNNVNVEGLADRSGTLAMVGFQSGAVTWGAGTPREAVVDAGTMADGTSPWDPLLVTYTPDGAFDCFWHLDTDVKYGMSAAVAWDGLGGLWVTGWFTERLALNEGMATEVTFETIPEDPTDPEGHHEPDVFLARFAPP
jgi:hypothetical protein